MRNFSEIIRVFVAKKRCLLLVALTVTTILGARADKQVYTSFDESTGTLTYYYDEQMSSRPQTEVYSPMSNPDAVRFKDYNDKVTKAVIDISMKEAEMSSCRCMFYGRVDEAYMDHPLSALTSIEGWENLNTSVVEDMSDMFNGCESLKELDLSSLNTTYVTTMNNMFHGCLALEKIDLSSFNTRDVTDMGSMFFYCEHLTSLNLNHFDMSSVTSVSNMFAYCTSLTTIYCNNDWSSDTQITISSGLFDGCNALQGGKGTKLSDVSKKDKTYACPDGLDEKSGLFTAVKEVYTEFKESSGTLTYYYDENRTTRSGVTEQYDPVSHPNAVRFRGYNEDVKKAVIDASMSAAGLTSMRSLFCGEKDEDFGRWRYLNEMTAIEGLEYLNTAIVTDMSNMFNGCKALESLNLSTFNTDKVTDMSGMFDSCEALTELNLTNFNTANVTNMAEMFFYCEALKSLDISKFNTDKVTDMSNMFNGCKALESLNLSNFNTANVTNMTGMFKSCDLLTALDLSNFNTEKVTEMISMFEDCDALESINISSFNTANVEQMHYMFFGCWALKSLDLSHFDTGKVTSMYEMFYGCSALTSLGLSAFNTANVTSMRAMFKGCEALTALDLSNFNTANVTDMAEMFAYCTALESLNITSFNTSNVTTMEDMFMFCTALKLLDISSFNTAKVKNMNSMFLNCKMLESLDLTNFDTGNLTNMTDMFSYCEALKTLDITPLNTVNVANMEGLFQGCTSLTSIDLSKLNTSKALSMTNMFRECRSLKELDLSRFNIAKVTYMPYMFEDCEALTTIYCDEDWNTIGSAASTDMFKGCINLIGGNGTIYDSGKTDCEYARPDGVDDKKGYFTEAKIWEVRFKDWDGTILKKENVRNGQAATAPEDPTRDGYTFIGWDEDFTHVTKDLTVTAMYQKKKTTFTVRFVDWDDTLLKKQTVEKGKDATAPEDPTRDGYVFIGWDKDYTDVQSDLIVTALYKPAEEALHNVQSDNVQCTKVLINGQLYILYNGTMYNVQGMRIGDL